MSEPPRTPGAVNVEDEVLEIVAEILPDRSDIDLRSAALTDVGLDSLAIVELVVIIESRFDIQFDDRDLVRVTFQTIASIAKAIVRQGVSRE